jgi:hypothetical protein
VRPRGQEDIRLQAPRHLAERAVWASVDGVRVAAGPSPPPDHVFPSEAPASDPPADLTQHFHCPAQVLVFERFSGESIGFAITSKWLIPLIFIYTSR